jgi:hypothetical protein
MAYNYFSINTEADAKKWQGFWTILGIYGDVAQEGRNSKLVLSNLRPKHPELFGSQLFWNPNSKLTYGYEIPMMLARYWNTPRRVAYQYGCPIALKACEEIEAANMPFGPMEQFDEILQAKMPNTYILRLWEDKYNDERSDVFKADNMKFLEFEYFTVSLYKHKWDLGGYVAAIKAGDRNKSHFAINTGLPEGIKITGRNPGKGDPKKSAQGLIPVNIDLGATLREAGLGGGHHMAASGGAPHGTSPIALIAVLVNTVTKRVEEKRETLHVPVETSDPENA